jgi:aldehyde dehydrogenase (NAD(P)+)
MRTLPSRIPYYPNSEQHIKEISAAFPAAEKFGDGIPRLLITDLDPNADNALCFQKEVFGPVLFQTSLPGKDTSQFLQNAVKFCNQRLFGTLGANVITLNHQTARAGLR